MLASLTGREREVIALRFGLDGRTATTLAKAGKQLGVTQERVRQIENCALGKLRHPARSQRLRRGESEWPNHTRSCGHGI